MPPGFLHGGNTVFAAGVGLQDVQPNKIRLNVPATVTIRQVLAYWGLRSAAGDNDVMMNGNLVTGDLIGTSTAFPGADTRPYVFRADITQLELIKNGANEVTVSGLNITDTGFQNGAEIVVLADDGSGSTLELRDGNDFAYWKFTPPVNETHRQRFSFPASDKPRTGELILVVADHKGIDNGKMRPSTLEVEIEFGGLQVIDNPIQGRDGDSWDTVKVPLTIPANARFVEAEMFSDTRTGSRESPSSFYWLFSSVRVEGAQANLTWAGTVYNDLNGNADRDPSETGIAGIEVTLSCTLAGQATQRSTFTGADGSYRFDGIAPGSTCTAAVVPSPALGDKESTEVCLTQENMTRSVIDCDFGFADPPIVGDTVFCDSNGDGAQQAAEKGIVGVRVVINAPAGGGFPGYSADMTTDADGKYLFRVPGVPANALLVATVSIDPQTGDARGKTLTTPNPQQTIPLGPGGIDIARDFGLKPPDTDAKVGDTVFADDNGNGRQDLGEQGLGDVAVRIVCPATDGFPALDATTRTDSVGKYLHTVPGIPAGKTVVCTVSIDPASGEANGRILTTANPQMTRPLGPGEMDLDRDFGLRPPDGSAVVGDTVFCDLNGNGRRDGAEPGIPGIPVSLSVPAGGGFPGSNQTATTGADGKYLFTIPGIPNGATVVATVSIDTASPAAARKTLTTPNPQTTRPLGRGAEDRDRDFGLKPIAAKVGDSIFCDQDQDGVFDPEDRPLAGVRVTINAPAVGAFGGFASSTTTDGQGKYLFLLDGIPPDTPVVAMVTVDPETGDAAGQTPLTALTQDTVPLGPGTEDLARDFRFRCAPTETKICLEEKTADAGDCVSVRVLLTTTSPVEGFVTAVRHEPGVRLDSITLAGTVTEANVVEFSSFEVLPQGGTAAAIMDIEPPFNGQTIPAGADQSIVVYRYCCEPLPSGSPPRTSKLEFVDDVLGTPPKENVIVVGGRSITPVFCNGSITCSPGGECPGPYFICGGTRIGEGNLPIPPRGPPGGRVELSFYYCSPEDNEPGHPQFDHLQGVTMALCHDCRLTCIEGSFRMGPDTISAALPVEFATFQCENDPNDGDGCEMILALLVDAVEPFDGQTLPPTAIPLKLGSVDLVIADNAPCGACLPVDFCDGINGRGKVPTKNVFAAENQSFPACTVNCCVEVTGPSTFRRGDCNGDMKANLADGAAVVTTLFQTGQNRYDPPCLDACDANDDGRLDIADTVRILSWLFSNAAPPPAPGPTVPGNDPTEDKLSCDNSGCPEG